MYRLCALSQTGMNKVLISSPGERNQKPGKNDPRFQVVNHWWPYTDPGIVFYSHIRPEYAIAHCGNQIWDLSTVEVEELNALYTNEFNGHSVFTQIVHLWRHWLGKDSRARGSILEEQEDSEID